MALSLFQWIGVGLGVAIVLIPTARWFWKRFDQPSKRSLEIMKRHEEDAEEAKVWAGIEAQVEAETAAKREIEMKQREKQERSGKSLDEDTSTNAWTKLGVDVPIQPVEREEAPPVILEKAIEESDSDDEVEFEETPDVPEEAEVPDEPDEPDEPDSAKEPDWELVKKMSKLAEPVAGVPDAPDLDELSDEESGSKEEDPDWPFYW
jgi:hypothetical protein